MRAAPGVAPVRPSGPRWQAFRRAMLIRWGPLPLCYYCGHPAAAPELAHLIPPGIAPHLGYSPENVKPAHGGGKRRCTEPGCQLACNLVAAGNLAPRGPGGLSLPFPPAFIADHQGQRSRIRSSPAPAAGPARPARPPRVPDVGREWLHPVSAGIAW
jgi:hypothetical protein